MLRVVVAAAAMLGLVACSTQSETDANARAGGAGASGQAAVDSYRPGSQEQLNATIGDRVFFAFDRYELDPQARATVERWAEWMGRYPSVSATIEGNTDERGTREYNLALGERRAQAVRDYMSALGVTGGRLSTVSYGKERPAVIGSNESAWAQNRRAVLIVN